MFGATGLRRLWKVLGGRRRSRPTPYPPPFRQPQNANATPHAEPKARQQPGVQHCRCAGLPGPYLDQLPFSMKRLAGLGPVGVSVSWDKEGLAVDPCPVGYPHAWPDENRFLCMCPAPDVSPWREAAPSAPLGPILVSVSLEGGRLAGQRGLTQRRCGGRRAQRQSRARALCRPQPELPVNPALTPRAGTAPAS